MPNTPNTEGKSVGSNQHVEGSMVSLVRCLQLFVVGTQEERGRRMGARDPMGDFLDRLEKDGSGAALLPAFLPGYELGYEVDQGMIRLL